VLLIAHEHLKQAEKASLAVGRHEATGEHAPVGGRAARRTEANAAGPVHTPEGITALALRPGAAPAAPSPSARHPPAETR
jgi:hypothetical protein